MFYNEKKFGRIDSWFQLRCWTYFRPKMLLLINLIFKIKGPLKIWGRRIAAFHANPTTGTFELFEKSGPS